MSKFVEKDVKKAIDKVVLLCGSNGCDPQNIYNTFKKMGFPAQEMIDHLLKEDLIRFDISSMTLRPTCKGWKF